MKSQYFKLDPLNNDSTQDFFLQLLAIVVRDARMMSFKVILIYKLQW